MEPAVLLKSISKPISKKAALALASENGDSFAALISYCRYGHPQIEFRASWILELSVRVRQVDFKKHLSDFIEMYCILKNESCQRHFTKIMMDLTSRCEEIFNDSELERVLSTTFIWMIDPQTPVAVRVNCMDILFNLRGRREWIADELRAQIDHMLKTGSAALHSRGKKIMRKL